MSISIDDNNQPVDIGNVDRDKGAHGYTAAAAASLKSVHSASSVELASARRERGNIDQSSSEDPEAEQMWIERKPTSTADGKQQKTTMGVSGNDGDIHVVTVGAGQEGALR
eukprot:CAMPEP_0197038428 /NCGR_PEP_ID=MMETSP1384-20130603/15376_1 /TAXON_ID=29189 /ORGANISM="Ammonia sp." /LENGTH=110 /DNA_ID=CAMNT_0042468861 /DNA_START=23 /DNA_END=352 /DNA_ORIENTATION=-